jgi:hypothetical protein
MSKNGDYPRRSSKVIRVDAGTYEQIKALARKQQRQMLVVVQRAVQLYAQKAN